MRQFLRPVPLTAIAWSLYQLYTAYIGSYHVMLQMPIHVAFALALTFLAFPLKQPPRSLTDNPDEPPAKAVPRWHDYLLWAMSIAIGVYAIIHQERIVTRIPFVDDVTFMDKTMAMLAVVLVLEATRRVAGMALVILSSLFLAYQVFGPAMPGALSHRGISFSDLTDMLFLTPAGLFGTATQVSNDFVFHFVLFGAFLEVSGAGKLFIDAAVRFAGSFRGGPAKAAVVSSSLFGTISGSAVANVVGTGTFTIPLMKRTGYPPAFAGAVEAVASTGGQIMPPVMGAGAFIMAEMLGIPYLRVALAAVIPALVYYVALFLAVDFKAAKEGLRGLTREQMPDMSDSWQRVHLAVPLVVLAVHIFAGYSLATSALRSLALLLVISWLRRSTGMNLVKILRGLEVGAKQAIQVAIPCAVAGIITGVVVQSGLGLKFTNLMMTLSGGLLLPALLFVMVGLLIMGMGMPTTSAYILGAVTMTAPLKALGITGLSAHMFIFYFACLSMVTPPVALAAFAAAGIAGEDMWKTGWTAFRLSLSAFIVPFAFVFNPALLFEGPLLETVWTGATAILGSTALAGSVVGYFTDTNTRWEGVVLFAAALSLITPEKTTDFVGLAAVVVVVTLQWVRRRRRLAQAAA